MDDIIKSIIEIDRGASKRIEDAEKEKLRIIEEAKAEEERMVEKAVEEKKAELAKLEKAELDKANARISELTEEKNAKLEAMKQSFEKNSDKWCEEIFKAVISI
ncbi:MAG: hypothetical protein ACI4J0_07285 [Huintestinicola sp.]|uniref:hypothetical protein n=1 Tax=Huintestinicola sp. TaxID=2981661 RepID=UPI003F0DAEFD